MKLCKTLLSLAVCIFMVANPALAGKTLMMATTTSTDNTGLLDYLAPEFTKDTGITLKWVAVGTGKALKMGENCDVDILFVHAPASEKKFVQNGFGSDRRQVMYNDFVIIGPVKDQAGIKGMSPAEGLKTIAGEKAIFLSRGDNSGTNKKELRLWQKAGISPDKEKWYIQTGQGMLSTINMAAEKDGYTLTDRGTWIKYVSQKGDDVNMAIVIEGDPELFNQYSVITVNKERCPNTKADLAKKFTDWVTGSRAQKLIEDFRLMGKPLFTPNAQ